MNRQQRRAFDKRVQRGDIPSAEHLQVCPVCRMRAVIRYFPNPRHRGECVPVCNRCGKITGPGVYGVAPSAIVPAGEVR